MAATRTAIIAGNWKMNYGPRQAADFVKQILPALAHVIRTHPHIVSILCPPDISLQVVRDVLDAQPTRGIELGAQNLYFEEKGAYTGEISAEMVKELCSAVILGHSERRTYFAETDELVNKKLLAALKHHLLPIVCVGETLQQYESGQTSQIIEQQVRHSLANLQPEQAGQIVIAYEPLWAIGSGKAATVDDAVKVIRQIRQIYSSQYGSSAAQAIRILYGGSVTADNIAAFTAQEDIDGALVGGASLKAEFVDLVRNSSQKK
ncbi:triose-phosphate isomerase [Tengunoibacter tsumagoiensis]|uniref:Triosephosphate isomerase n=1 Tax=Tengunoibacter tsumagoiensis TaxID=2014871 RepID=A0A401ZV91_9CHLR|nr:triose-phosphate isomerase [Tengunoibacter tsumagoiensis]GCE10706.1 triosephosphate isomerase [Tengunoibacter tsumagoiensis]